MSLTMQILSEERCAFSASSRFSREQFTEIRTPKTAMAFKDY